MDPRRARMIAEIEERYGMPLAEVFETLRGRGLTWAQIADELGIGLSTVYTWRQDKQRKRTSSERAAIARRVVQVAESQRLSLADAVRIVADELGMRPKQVYGVYGYAVERGECRPARLQRFRPVTMREVQRIGTLMQVWRRRGRTVQEALQLTANELGRSAATVYQYWYEGLRSGQWTDPGKRRHRQSLASVVGGIGS